MQFDFRADQYANDVVSGRILACKWVKLACKRYIDDRANAHKRGLIFDEDAAKIAVGFFPAFLRHWKGEWGGQPIELEPWQQFVTWNLFGWKREDGLRRFRTCYLEVARKNGKTTWAAGIGIILMIADGEQGAEIYSAATKRDQAKIVFEDAKQMVRQSSMLSKMVKTFKLNLHSSTNNSKFEPLASDAKSLDGLNVHAALVDEIHEHKTRDVWDKLKTATGARRQPMTIGITTAGTDRNTICYDLHIFTQQVLNGAIDDDSFFGMIFTLDEGDDWRDETVWIKSNPSLAFKKIDQMRSKAKEAAILPAAQNAFLRLEMNVWTQSVTRWINRDLWDACGRDVIDEELLRGRTCYGGLDLSSNTDITAFVLVFGPLLPWPEEGSVEPITLDHKYIMLPRFFVPEDNIALRIQRDRVPYNVWAEQGYITLTDGNVVDFEFVLDQVARDADKFDLQEVAFDRWGAAKVVSGLQDRGLTMIEFGQGFASMNSPMKTLEKLYMSGRLAHGSNPVLTWMADNLVVKLDPAGNIKPDKEKSIEKIDGMVGLVMGLDRADRHQPVISVYEKRGIRTL